MSPVPTRLRVALIALSCAVLAGCISVLPKAKPALLYRFDGATQTATVGGGGSLFGVLRGRGAFQRASSSDRILAVTGGQVAYIAESRWVAPASVLFDEAVARAFDANRGPARLINRGEVGKADYVLRLDVRNFEAVYDNGAEAAPQVVVRLRAGLARNRDKVVVAEQNFEARVRASDNRVSAITTSFDQAVGEVLAKLVAWTNDSGRGA